MNRLTFDRAYEALQSYAPPTTAEFIRILNEVCERFLSSGKWLGTTEVLDFEASQGRIALPKQFSAILAAQIEGRGTQVYGRFHEYITGGPGHISPEVGAGMQMLVDEGDGHPLEKDFETPVRLVVQTFDPADAYDPQDPNTPGKMYVKGYGTTATSGGSPVLVELEIPLPTPSTPFVSTEVFERITSVVKPITYGDVALYGWNLTDYSDMTGYAGDYNNGADYGIGDIVSTPAGSPYGNPGQLFIRVSNPNNPGYPPGTSSWAVYSPASEELTPLSVYVPEDTAPSFRRYKVSSLLPITHVRAVCKRRFIPVDGNKDEIVIPGNLGALKLGMLAINYENKNDLERAEDYWQKAFSTLNLEMREFRGGAINRGQIDPSSFQIRRLRNFY